MILATVGTYDLKTREVSARGGVRFHPATGVIDYRPQDGLPMAVVHAVKDEFKRGVRVGAVADAGVVWVFEAK